MRRRRFGLFNRSELAAASFMLMEAVTDELLREFLRSPEKTTQDMCEYLAAQKVEKHSIEEIFQTMELACPRLLSVIRSCKEDKDPQTLAKEEGVILPFVDTCLEVMARQQEVEPMRSLQEGYYY